MCGFNVSSCGVLALVIGAFAYLTPRPAFSDEVYSGEPPSIGTTAQTMADVAKVGSAASFDKRLPPVIPGENIQHNGRTMKVWSSAGPVPVGQVPAPPAAPQAPGQAQVGGALPNLGVIVDQRHRSDSNR